MKTFGFLVVAAAVLGAGLYFGGYVGGDVDVTLTENGRSAYNRGVEQVQQGVGELKVEAKSTFNKGVTKAQRGMDKLRVSEAAE